MQIKEVKPITFLFFRTVTQLKDLIDYLPVGQELFREAVQNKLDITGPIHWHYFGFTGDETKPFTLEVALPVATAPQEYDGTFHFKRTEPFKCVSTVHEGSWTSMPLAYEKMVAFIFANKLEPLAMNREIYTNVDFTDQASNVTEIQMGIV